MGHRINVLTINILKTLCRNGRRTIIIDNCCCFSTRSYGQKLRFLSGTSISSMNHSVMCRDISSTHNFRFASTGVKEVKEEHETEKKVSEKIVVSETLSRKEKLKKAVKEYGSTVIVFHIGISLISLGTSYALVSMGLDITSLFESIGLKNWISNSNIATNAGTFAVAYAIHKVFAPVRITITLASVPFIVRYLRKIGFLKK